MSDSENSVTLMLAKLKSGDEEAANLIWRRFFDRVTALARVKLGEIPKRSMDEDDIAISAMQAMYAGVRDGRFDKLENRDDLWQILCMLTSRKAATAWRKHQATKSVGESAVAAKDDLHLGIQHIAVATPDTDYLNSLSHLCKELLEGLDSRLQEVALLRLHGYSNQEIADKIGRSVKSVERYVKSIRIEWTE